MEEILRRNSEHFLHRFLQVQTKTTSVAWEHAAFGLRRKVPDWYDSEILKEHLRRRELGQKETPKQFQDGI